VVTYYLKNYAQGKNWLRYDTAVMKGELLNCSDNCRQLSAKALKGQTTPKAVKTKDQFLLEMFSHRFSSS